MTAVFTLALKEIRDGLRNRWVAAAILALAALALSLALLGAAPGGGVKASALSVTVVSLSSLTVYLLPLIALLLSYDALVGEFERGTMLLLLSYPLARWQVVVGKFLGHIAIIVIAVIIGYGAAAAVIAWLAGGDGEGWRAFIVLIASSVLLGIVFVGIGYLLSALARERASAAGLALGVWLVMVVLYDFALLGILIADTDQSLSKGLVTSLMLFNPTDSFRMFNLLGTPGVSTAAGLAGVGMDAGVATPLAIMVTWTVVPLAAAAAIFQRKEL